jgi:hypothetical protein
LAPSLKTTDTSHNEQVLYIPCSIYKVWKSNFLDPRLLNVSRRDEDEEETDEVEEDEEVDEKESILDSLVSLCEKESLLCKNMLSKR